MKLRFSKKEKVISIILTSLIVMVFVSAQFLFLYPLKSELKTKEQQLVSQQKLLDVITQKKQTTEGLPFQESSDIQKKIPVKPMQEQFILDLEKAETISNSQINSMSFTKDAEVVTAETGTENTTAADSSTTQETADPEAEKPSVTGLKKISVSLSVKSPSYKELEKFIETLESLKRIVVVESINYSGGEEITSLEQEIAELSYTLTVSAYYFPELDDLIAELPNIDAPDPANKDNPLSTFADTTKTN